APQVPRKRLYRSTGACIIPPSFHKSQRRKQMDALFLVLLAIVAIIFLTVVFGSFFTVRTAEVAIVTRFGKFLRIAEPGLNWKYPFFDTVAGTVSLRVNQITLTMET